MEEEDEEKWLRTSRGSVHANRFERRGFLLNAALHHADDAVSTRPFPQSLPQTICFSYSYFSTSVMAHSRKKGPTKQSLDTVEVCLFSLLFGAHLLMLANSIQCQAP